MDEELSLHALKDFRLARHIWQASELEGVASKGFATLVDSWEWVRGELGLDEWEHFITLSWVVWGREING